MSIPNITGTTWNLTQQIHSHQPGTPAALTMTFNSGGTLTAKDAEGKTFQGRWHQMDILNSLYFHINGESSAALLYLGNVLGASMGGWVQNGLLPTGIWSATQQPS